MGLFDKTKNSTAADRLFEDEWYKAVVHELESGIRNDAAWARAIEKCKGDEITAKGIYITFRIQQMKDEVELTSHLREARENDKLNNAEKEKQFEASIERERDVQRVKEIIDLLQGNQFDVYWGRKNHKPKDWYFDLTYMGLKSGRSAGVYDLCIDTLQDFLDNLEIRIQGIQEEDIWSHKERKLLALGVSVTVILFVALGVWINIS